MNRRRVLHCIPGMGGGGAERQLAYLAGPLSDLGWDVHVGLISEGPNFQRLERSGATVHRIAARSNYDPRIGWQLARLMGQLRPDIAQLWLFQMEIAGALAASWHRIPWILSERSSEGAYPPSWRPRLRVALSAHAAAIVANSAEGERYWARQRRVKVPRFVVANAVPYEEIMSSAPGDVREFGFSASDRLILFVGRLSPEKNVLTLFAALMALMPDMPGTVALLGGDGPLRRNLDFERAATSLAGRLALPGYVRAPWTWMKRADVFVSVAPFEGHPNAVLEAAACGTPLVLSEIAAHRAFLDDDCAVFVSPNDPMAIAAAIRTVLSHSDAARARAMRAAARTAHLSVRRIAREYDDIYQQILGLAAQSKADHPFKPRPAVNPEVSEADPEIRGDRGEPVHPPHGVPR